MAVETRPHALARLVQAPGSRARALRYALAALAVAIGLAMLRFPVESLQPEWVYAKDFVQEYLLAKALLDGTNPYLPVPELSARYFGELSVRRLALPHPTPHPPTAGIVFLPLALLDYPTAAAVLLWLKIASLVASIYLVGRSAATRLSPLWAAAIAVTLVSWYPFMHELLMGQVGLFILVLLAGSRAAWLSERPILGGSLIGLALLVKPLSWPLLLLFAIRRDWRALVGSLSTIGLGYALATGLMGPGRMLAYLTQILPEVNAAYRAFALNGSLWSIGWRVFDGTSSSAQAWIAAPPLIHSEVAAAVVSAALPLLLVAVACLSARRQPDPDFAFGLMVAVCILVSPISWGHYFVLAVIPGAWVIRWLWIHGLPSRETTQALLLVLFLVPSVYDWSDLAFRLTGQVRATGENAALAFGPALLTYGPTLAMLGLVWLLIALASHDQSTTEVASWWRKSSTERPIYKVKPGVAGSRR